MKEKTIVVIIPAPIPLDDIYDNLQSHDLKMSEKK